MGENRRPGENPSIEPFFIGYLSPIKTEENRVFFYFSLIFFTISETMPLNEGSFSMRASTF